MGHNTRCQMPNHSRRLTAQSEVQGKVYHWTISTGFSLAEATNMFVGRREHLVQCAQDWLHLMEQCCKQVQWGSRLPDTQPCRHACAAQQACSAQQPAPSIALPLPFKRHQEPQMIKTARVCT